MCLILFAIKKHPEYKLILAANRDEFFERPSLEAHFWEDDKTILGGRDLKSGGTWLGLTKGGRFIAITNYRDPGFDKTNPVSRGKLSIQYLSSNITAIDFLSELSTSREKYNGFNILLSDDCFDTFYHYSNINDESTKIKEGVHGLSNHLLDTPWPKVIFGKQALSQWLETDSLDTNSIFQMLRNRDEANENMLPDTGISSELEKKLSPVFISMKGYGTRCSTLLLLDYNNNLSFFEVTYNDKKQITGDKSYHLKLKY